MFTHGVFKAEDASLNELNLMTWKADKLRDELGSSRVFHQLMGRPRTRGDESDKSTPVKFN